MTTALTYEVTLTHRELALVVRGLRAVAQQCVADPVENTEVHKLRGRLAMRLSEGRAKPP